MFGSMRHQTATQLVVMYEIGRGLDMPAAKFLDGSALDWGCCARAQQHFDSIDISINEDKNDSAGPGQVFPCTWASAQVWKFRGMLLK